MADEVIENVTEQLSKSALKKQAKEKEKAQRKAERETKANDTSKVENDYAADKYGVLPINQSETRTGRVRVKVDDIEKNEGKVILMRARVHTTRGKGKQCFMVLRQQNKTVQALLAVNENSISKPMVTFAGRLKSDSIVLVEALVVKAFQEVSSCTVKHFELQIISVFVESDIHVEKLPFSVEDAQRPEPSETGAEGDSYNRVNLDTRLDNRIIDLRSITNHSIFKVQAGVSKLFREFLDSQGFVEIHTPKIISTASEGGSNVFKVSYFKSKS